MIERDDINPEIEENAEEHFEALNERDEDFRKEWDARRLQRELGDRLLERRLALGLSQRELAERTGTSQNRIYLIENGEANPTLDTLKRLAEVLGTRLAVELIAPASWPGKTRRSRWNSVSRRPRPGCGGRVPGIS